MTNPEKRNAPGQGGITNEAANQNSKQHHCTKQDMIAAILRTRSLNRFEAERYGDHCLHSTISTLRGLGYIYADQWETVPTRFGKDARVKRYHHVRSPGAA